MPKNPTQNIRFTNNLQARYPNDVRFDSARLPGGINYASGQILGEIQTARRNDVQTITIGATGGSYRIGYQDLTAALAYNANAAAIQAAMDAVIGAGNVVVTGTGPFVLTAAAEYGNRPLPDLIIDNGSATGGSVTVAHTTLGSVGVGGFAAWDPTRSDGAEVARAILWDYVKTNDKGERLGEWGAKQGDLTFRIAYSGEFPASKLIGLNSITLPQLGKIVSGGYDYTAGVNEIHTITYDAANTGGSLRLEVDKPDGTRVTTGAITWNGTDATYLASIQTALDTATGVVNGIVAGGLPDTALTLTYSGTGYAKRRWALPRVITFPTSSAAANYARSTNGYANLASGTIVKIGV